ncbi:MAG: TonB-dependent receptor [Deltaproteobacteria bacterium]|nr:TonB-dependent receptor [Deltaproteobacteria bacterium]
MADHDNNDVLADDQTLCTEIDKKIADDEISTNNKKESDISLPTLFVTADKVGISIEDLGRSVAVKSKQDLENKKATTLNSGIEDVSGILATDTGGLGAPGLATIRIRGFGSAGTKVLLNGLTLDDPSATSGTFYTGIAYTNLSGIDKIEILKGSSGVLYGFDAQAGVVNLITKQPTQGLNNSFGFEGGANRTFIEKESSATVLDLVLGYNLTKDFEFYVKANNVLNEKYTEGGYTMPRGSVFSGIKLLL